MEFKDKYSIWVEAVNEELNRIVPDNECPHGDIYKAMVYSLMAGGKRIRPILALAVNELFGGKEDEILPFCCAIEMIHTYSLIHDDLPAMDNDDYRRGRLTNHKVFGEGKAILAGDALLNRAFEVMTKAALSNTENIIQKVKAISIISEASGADGMIGGQVIDMDSEGKKIPIELLEYMHALKTGALIKAPVLAAAAINNASMDEYRSLETYAQKIGLAFQIKDDILDVEGDSELMGKNIGSDVSNEKSTFVTIYGLTESKEMLNALIDEAVNCIERFGEKSEFLKKLAFYIIKREN